MPVGRTPAAPCASTRRRTARFDSRGAFRYNYRLSDAGIAQLVERNLAKVEVGSSRLLSRSSFPRESATGSPFSFARPAPPRAPGAAPGGVAEWSCSGLQSRLRRFDSDPRLQKPLHYPPLSDQPDPALLGNCHRIPPQCYTIRQYHSQRRGGIRWGYRNRTDWGYCRWITSASANRRSGRSRVRPPDRCRRARRRVPASKASASSPTARACTSPSCRPARSCGASSIATAARSASTRIGAYPEVTLAEARDERDEARDWLREGKDPVAAAARRQGRGRQPSRRTRSRPSPRNGSRKQTYTHGAPGRAAQAAGR